MTKVNNFLPTRYYSFYPLKNRKDLILIGAWTNGNMLEIIDLSDGTTKNIIDYDACWNYYEEL